MQHEVKKVALIINEIITMELLDGAEDIDVNIKREGGLSKVHIIYHNCGYTSQFIEKINYNLNTQRQNEVEGYYWQLAGDDNNGDELYLVGAMIDDAQVELINKDLHIRFTRKK